LAVIRDTFKTEQIVLSDSYYKKFTELETGGNYSVTSRVGYIYYDFSGISLRSKDVEIVTTKSGAFEYFNIIGKHSSLQEMDNIIMSYNELKESLSNVSGYINYYTKINNEWKEIEKKRLDVVYAIELLDARIVSIEKGNRIKAINKERKNILKVAEGFFKAGQTIYSYTYFDVTKKYQSKELRVKDNGGGLFFEATNFSNWKSKIFPYNKKNVHYFYSHFNNPAYVCERDDYGNNYLKIVKNHKFSKTSKFEIVNISQEEYDKGVS
jgi:hypothetical protein